MNKETHEPEIEVEILNPEEIETQEEEIELSALALDGDLIETLYQEQMQEQQTDEAHVPEETHAEENEPSENVPSKKVVSSEDTLSGGKDSPGEDPPGGNESSGENTSGGNNPSEEDFSGENELSGEISSEGNKPSNENTPEKTDSTEAGSSDDIASPAAEAEEEFDFSGEVTLDESELSGLDFSAKGAAAGTAVVADADTASDGMGTEKTPEGDSAGEETADKPKKKSLFRRILKGVLVTLEVLFLIFIVYVVAIIIQADSAKDLVSRLSQSLLGKTAISAVIQDDYEDNVQETVDSEQISTNEGLDTTTYTLEGEYTSFVIFGVDARGEEFDNGTNSDTIIIVTVQNETGRVRMASIYRDTYLQIESSNGSVHYAKANSAYSSGGAVRALNMLNTNFDLALEDYVVVNFAGVADIIDELGGLDITLSKGEVYQLNYHLGSSMKATGLTADKITSAGLNHLNGVQALTYARIRKVSFTDPETGEVYTNDYGRTKRQQYVISLLAEKAKAASISELTAIVNRVFSYNTEEEKVIGTTYAFDEIISMIPLALNFTLDGGEGYPDNKTTMVMSDLNGADCVIATDLVADVTALHEYLYDEEDYSPTATVRNIADIILERAESYGTPD